MATNKMASQSRKSSLILTGLLVTLGVAGLVVLYIITHRGGEFHVSDDVTAYTLPRSFANSDSGLGAEGQLVVAAGGCLAVKSDGRTYFLGLPSGSHADASGRAVVAGEDKDTGQEMKYTVGDTIFGAGALDEDSQWITYVKRTWPHTPEACLQDVAGVLRLTATEKALS